MRPGISALHGLASPASGRLMGAALLIVAVLMLAACGDKGSSEGPSGERAEKLKVVTSLGIFADFVREVGGDRVEVTSLLPAGADPHTFEPTPKDAQRLSQAEVVFINGLGLEAPIEAVIRANLKPKAALFELSSAFPGQDEPHLWLDVQFAASYVDQIRGALTAADPAGEEVYEANSQIYRQELNDLDQGVRDAVARIPPERRKLVTFHRSFGHFAERYGLLPVGFVVPGPGQEPSARDVADLIETVEEEGVPAVFVEPQFNAAILERLADDVGVPVCTLYSDALDQRVRTYVELMRFNIGELLRCLGGESDG